MSRNKTIILILAFLFIVLASSAARAPLRNEHCNEKEGDYNFTYNIY